MKFRTAALAALFLLSALPSAAALKAPTAAMMAPIQTVTTAMNTGNPRLLSGLFAANATVVDEFAPYSWQGPSAGTDWFNGFGAFARHIKLTQAHATLGTVKNFGAQGNRAYIVVPASFDAKMNGKPVHETGTWTFTLMKSGTKWLIVTESWGTISMTM